MADMREAIFGRAHEGQTKFDYFLCSVAGAVFAYTVQNYTPQKLDSGFSALQTLALVCLAFSFGAGIRKIQLSNFATRLNLQEIEAQEGAEKITTTLNSHKEPYQNLRTGRPASRQDLESERASLSGEAESYKSRKYSVARKASRLAIAQLWILFLGFLLILSAKIVEPYSQCLSQPSIAITPQANKSAPISPAIDTNKVP